MGFNSGFKGLIAGISDLVSGAHKIKVELTPFSRAFLRS